ncbi:GS3-like protein isoform X1 [Iris pallida]|uniref:GS3-like protein isoform X1 n=1 Tax=Iris pallida TaxID=29817 RepID=A0AAX6EP10_IRIPA|nr:GS3-like protein isoform X1 [Iris pallida]
MRYAAPSSSSNAHKLKVVRPREAEGGSTHLPLIGRDGSSSHTVLTIRGDNIIHGKSVGRASDLIPPEDELSASSPVEKLKTARES